MSAPANMPTPSEQSPMGDCPLPDSERRRSVFANFDPPKPTHAAPEPESPIGNGQPASREQSAISNLLSAISRAFLYRFLAKGFEYPDAEGWCWLTHAETHQALWSAVESLAEPESCPLQPPAQALVPKLQPSGLDGFVAEHIAAFGHAARGVCPLNEIEYGDLKADPLFQPHRLADLAAFYRAFGLELAPDADERHDHICLELEFMSVLAAKEAYAREHHLPEEQLALSLEAQKKFLREHLGRWVPAFARRLARTVGTGTLGALANLTEAVILADCRRFGVHPGSPDLVLRPVNQAAESLCASCGVSNP